MRENLIDLIDATLCNSRNPCPIGLPTSPHNEFADQAEQRYILLLSGYFKLTRPGEAPNPANY
jgi:hypothetical protein